MRYLVVALALIGSSISANAEGWTLQGTSTARIPASISGAQISGAALRCKEGRWSLKLDANLAASNTSGRDVPVVLWVDQRVFPVIADKKSFFISVPAQAISALKIGRRLKLTIPIGGLSVEVVFALDGTRKVIEVIEGNCSRNPGAAAEKLASSIGQSASQFSQTSRVSPTEASPNAKTPTTRSPAATRPGNGSTHVVSFSVKSIAAGSKLSVTFSGPARSGDWIGFARVGSPPSSWQAGSWKYTKSGSPLIIKAPTKLGAYEVRYASYGGGPIKVYAARPIKVTASTPDVIAEPKVKEPVARPSAVAAPTRKEVQSAGHSLSVPTMNVTVGAELEVGFSGPSRRGDWIGFAPVGAVASSWLPGSWKYTTVGNPLIIKAPKKPGEYELRYASYGNGPVKVYTTRTIKVTSGAPVKVALPKLTAPAVAPSQTVNAPTSVERPTGGAAASPTKPKLVEVSKGAYSMSFPGDKFSAGSSLKIAFSGPANNRDWVGFVEAGRPADTWLFGSYNYTRYGNPAVVNVPNEPGAYEIRYASHKDKRVYLSKKVTVTTAKPSSIDGPTSVTGGLPFEIKHSGPVNKNNFVAIMPANARASVEMNGHSVRVTKKKAIVRAPIVPGEYHLRYVLGGDDNMITAHKKITVTKAPTVSLSAPTEATAGRTIQVKLGNAPRAEGDRIFVTAKGMPQNDRDAGSYNVAASGPVAVKVPAASGAYGIRYVVPVEGSYRALGQTDLTVVSGLPVPAIVSGRSAISIKAIDSVAGGTPVFVDHSGPTDGSHFIAIVPANASAKARIRGNWLYVKKSPTAVRAPTRPGSYEIRMVKRGRPAQILAKRKIDISPAPVVSVRTAAEARRGQQITIDFGNAPRNRGDRVVISPKGSPSDYYAAYWLVPKEGPLRIRLPSRENAIGPWELRYAFLGDGGMAILGRTPIKLR